MHCMNRAFKEFRFLSEQRTLFTHVHSGYQDVKKCLLKKKSHYYLLGVTVYAHKEWDNCPHKNVKKLSTRPFFCIGILEIPTPKTMVAYRFWDSLVLKEWITRMPINKKGLVKTKSHYNLLRVQCTGIENGTYVHLGNRNVKKMSTENEKSL